MRRRNLVNNLVHINDLYNYENTEALSSTALKVLEYENINGNEVVITLADDNFIKELNLKYRNINTPTDVLSFSLGEDNILGDIIISIPTAKKNAVKYNDGKLISELIKLTVHGVLHLLGYDHELESDAEIMEKREEEILHVISSGSEKSN